MPKPPHWIPWLGPVAAVAAGALVARFWLHGGLWTTLIAALVCGFAPIVGYRVWKLLHHKKTD
jgi:4-hydroxybenzoate polyprenyltransferase